MKNHFASEILAKCPALRRPTRFASRAIGVVKLATYRIDGLLPLIHRLDRYYLENFFNGFGLVLQHNIMLMLIRMEIILIGIDGQ
ncbi:MAG: hypothetical protein RI887_1081 [Actinomycetota bacterium]